MPRSRKSKLDKWMPDRVYRGRSAYELHPKLGGSIRLCSLDATESEVWKAYRDIVGGVKAKDCEWLAGLYFESDKFNELSPRAQVDYKAHWKSLSKAFGKMNPMQVRPDHVQDYMDLRGKQSKTMANKERKVFRLILRYGMARGKVRINACDPVDNFSLPTRTRYITDDEYQAFYDLAEPILQVCMEIAYTCAARGQDVRMLKLSDDTKRGLFIKQQKTGKAQLKLYSPRLRQAVDRAKELRAERVKDIDSIYLILSADGKPYTEYGLKSLWRRAKAKYYATTKQHITFTFHDLKAKGVSDFDGDKQNFSGHKSKAMMEKYNRTPDETTVIDFKRKNN